MRRAVAAVYAEAAGAPIRNEVLYESVRARAGVEAEAFHRKKPIGKTGSQRSTIKRAIRWQQQSLKMRGWLERVEGCRGKWKVTRDGKMNLRRLAAGQTLIAFRTDLGVAVWGDCGDAIAHLPDTISLVLTSPPYPIRAGRAYGAIEESRYVDWLCRALSPSLERLRAGGSLALNLGNEVFLPGSPARSLYQERLILALADRFGLQKLDTLIWASNKAPGPVQWASKKRVQLNAAYEPLIWLSNDPHKVSADNRRVLEPHSQRHQRDLAKQSFGRERTSGDGAYHLRPGKSFANVTPGRIPRNIRNVANTCAHQRRLSAAARAAGLPVHGAVMPLELARFMVRYLSAPQELVADPMAGRLTTAVAAELEGRPWWAAERYGEYVAQAAPAFMGAPGFSAA